MATPQQTLIDLEKKFWQALVDQDSDSALDLLTEPALIVNSNGAFQFDHAEYRKMAEDGPMEVKSFELSDVNVLFPNESTAVLTYRARQEVLKRGDNSRDVWEVNDTSTWVRTDGKWLCAMHTETPASSPGKTQ